MERDPLPDHRHRPSPLAAWATFALIQLTACAEREVWTGRRCANPQLACGGDSEESDAGESDAGESDARAAPALVDAESPTLQPVDAGSLDACLDCAPAPQLNAKCVAGHYSGQVHARYVPTPAGLCGLLTLFGGEGSTALDFDLEAMGGEMFSVVGETCIDLTIVPDAGPDDELLQGVERKMGMRGKLDCSTGEFEGEVRGTYSTVSLCDLGTTKTDYFFKGPMTARFDPTTRSFVGGQLILREPPVALALGGAAGGEGTWSAKLNPDAGVPAERRDCLGGIRFPEELFPADAGM